MMEEQKEQKVRNKKKIIAGTVSIVLALAMLLGGTYAAFYAPDKLANLVKGEGAGFPIFGHDDFVRQDDGSYNKDIYVENTGTTPAYVRVKLEETFIHHNTVICGTKLEPDKDGKTTLVGDAHIPATNEDVTIGKTEKDQVVHRFFTWKMGREGSGTDGTEGGLYFLSANAKTAGGGSDYYVAQKEKTDSDKIFFENNIARNNSGHTYVKDQTNVGYAPPCKVITMDAYMEYKDKTEITAGSGETSIQDFKGWVIDEDGWCYWSQPLGAGQTTGLLLDHVNIKQPPQYDYTYQIDVTFQAVDEYDKNIWLDPNVKQTYDKLPIAGDQAATENGRALLHILAGEQKGVAQAMAKGDIAKGTQVDGKAVPAEGKAALYYQAADALKAGKTHPADPTTGENYLGVYETRMAQANDAENLSDTETVDLNGIDPAIRQYVLGTYGKEGKLTKDQAQAVTEIRITDATKYGQVKTLNGLTLTLFPNLDVIQCRDSAITTENFQLFQSTSLANQLKVLDLTGDQQLTDGSIVGNAFPNLLVYNLDRTMASKSGWASVDDTMKSMVAYSAAEIAASDLSKYNFNFSHQGTNNIEYLNFRGSKLRMDSLHIAHTKLKYVDMEGINYVKTTTDTPIQTLPFDYAPLLGYLNCRNLAKQITTVNLAAGAFSKTYEPTDIAGGWGVGVLDFTGLQAEKPCLVDTGCNVTGLANDVKTRVVEEG